MASLDLFHYEKSQAILHRIDMRLKLLITLILTISIFNSNRVSLIFCTACICSLFLLNYKQSNILSPWNFMKQTRGFLIFLITVILIKSFTLKDDDLSIIPFLSRNGLIEGGLYSWKLFLILILGHLLISSSDPADIQGALYKILNPIPFIPAGTIATMVSLSIMFIPLLFEKYMEINDAINSRLGYTHKNPIRKITILALPLMQSTIASAEEISLAMESRCYRPDPTLPLFKFKKVDFYAILILLIFLSIIFMLK